MIFVYEGYTINNLRREILSLIEKAKALSQDSDKKLPGYQAQKLSYLDDVDRAGAAFVQLILAYRQAKRPNEDALPQLLNFSELGNLLTQLVNQKLDVDEVKRQSCILQIGPHFDNCDIQVRGTTSGNRISLVMLDAANAFFYQSGLLEMILAVQKKHPFIEKVYWTSASIQHDEISCYIFSLKLLLASMKDKNFHEHIAQLADSEGKINWADLPPKYLKLAQSMTFLDDILLEAYLRSYAKNFNSGQDLDPVIDKFQKLGLSEEKLEQAYSLLMSELNVYAAMKPIDIDSIVSSKKQQTLPAYLHQHSLFHRGKQRNVAATDTFDHYAGIITKLLAEVSDDDLLNILEGKIAFPLEKEKPAPK